MTSQLASVHSLHILSNRVTYFINASDQADCFADILRQHRAVDSWFGWIQYRCHFHCRCVVKWRTVLLCLRTKRGKPRYVVFLPTYSPWKGGVCNILGRLPSWLTRDTYQALLHTQPLCFTIFRPLGNIMEEVPLLHRPPGGRHGNVLQVIVCTRTVEEVEHTHWRQRKIWPELYLLLSSHQVTFNNLC